MNGDLANRMDEALALIAKGEFEQALDAAHVVLEIDPGHAPAMFIVGLVGAQMNEFGVAIKVLEDAHRIDPDFREVVVLLAFYSAFVGRLKDSLYYSKLAIATPLNPRFAAYLPEGFADVSQAIQHLNIQDHVLDATIGVLLEDWKRAERACRRELAINPGNGQAWLLLSLTFVGTGALTAAVAAARSAVEQMPDDVEARLHLGDLLARDGRFFEGLECYRAGRAAAADPAAATARILTAIEGFPADFAQLLAPEYAAFQAALPAAPAERPAPGQGKLRIGYIVNEHAERAYRRVLAPLWAAHDPNKVETFVFQQFMSSDLPLGRLRDNVTLWREVRGLDDDTLAYMVRGEGIDILIDLCGVTANNRARMLAAKPAPVCLGWLAPGTAELGALYDGVLVDEWSQAGAVPPVAVAGGAQCFEASMVAEALARDLPVTAAANDGLTFGARLELGEVVPAMRHWAAVLRAFPGSTLYLGCIPIITNDMVERVLELAANFGCASRIRFQAAEEGVLPEEVFLAGIDILLTPPAPRDVALVADALWLGVPALTWQGGRPAGGGLASVLGMVCRSQWCVADPAALAEVVAAIAPDAAGLAETRRRLAEDVRRSRLFDVAGTAAALEEVFAGLAAARR